MTPGTGGRIAEGRSEYDGTVREVIETKLGARYRVVRELEPGVSARRLLLKHIELHTMHTAHVPLRESEAEGFGTAAKALLGVRISHIAPVEDLVVQDDGVPAIVTPYYGHALGLVTLEQLGASRGGKLTPQEIEAAGDHILHAMDDAHGGRLYNGPLSARQVLIDRQGRVQLEHFGLGRMLERGVEGARIATEGELREEVRSVLELLFRCLTGLDPRTIGVSAGQVVSSLDPLLDEWLAKGLRESDGFESAAAARAAMPENLRVVKPRDGALASAMRRIMGIAGL